MLRVLTLFVALSMLLFQPTRGLSAGFNQEFPPPSSIETLNGARLFGGWKCNHGEITRAVDGGPQVAMASRLSRGDTIPPFCETCCDNDGSNGYAELINVPLFGEGRHTIEFYDDGVKFAEAEFDVIKVRGDNFLKSEDLAGAQKTFLLQGFPGPGENVIVSWSQREQGFFVTSYCPMGECVAEEGLVAFWSFDECDARDDSGNGHAGIMNGNPACVAVRWTPSFRPNPGLAKVEPAGCSLIAFSSSEFST